MLASNLSHVFGDVEVENMTQFRNLVSLTTPGQKVEMEIVRDGKKKRLSVEIGEYPGDGEGEARTDEEEIASPLLLGLGLETLSDHHRRQIDIPAGMRGVIITAVNQNSPAADSGLAEGDIILEVNRERIDNLDEFNRVIERSDKNRYLLFVYRGGRTFYRILKD